MTAAKHLFQKKNPEGQSLCEWWVGIARDERFAAVLTFCRAHMMEGRPEHAHVEGAEVLIDILLTLPDNDDFGQAFPNPGLVHKIDKKKPSTETK